MWRNTLLFCADFEQESQTLQLRDVAALLHSRDILQSVVDWPVTENVGSCTQDGSEPVCCADFEQEGHPLQLRDVAALLRKGDDPQAVLKGLKVIGPLIEAAPEELSHSAGALWHQTRYHGHLFFSSTHAWE